MSKATIMQSLFKDEIPTKAIHGNHIDTSKMSEEYKRNAMKNFIPASQSLPDDEAINKMAYTSGKRIVQAEKTITREGSWEDVVEENKAKKTTDPNLGLNGIRVAHMGSAEESISPQNKPSSSSVDAAISEYSRQTLRNDRRNELDRQQKEIENIPVARAADRDPISGIRKGIANISEVAAPPKPFPARMKTAQPTQKEQEQKAQNVVTAIELLKDHNQKKINSMMSSKNDWAEDSISRTNERVAKSVHAHRERQESRLSDHHQTPEVTPEKVADTFRQYFSERDTNLSKVAHEIAEDRSHIRRERKIETTLDKPSLPSRTSNRNISMMDSLMDKLPDHVKEKALNG